MGSAPSRAVFAVSSDVYHVYLHTGCKLPQANTIKKIDGTIKITINPGANEDDDPEATVCQSKILKIKEKFSSHSEGTVDVEFWVPKEERVGEPKLLKIELDGGSCSCICTKDPLYIREVTVMWDNKTYRFPIHNYLSPYTPSRSCCGSTEDGTPQQGCVPYLYATPGHGTLKHNETEDFILRAREKDHNITNSMMPWENADKVGPIPSWIDVKGGEYENLPRFLQFRDAWLDAFEGARDAGEDKMKCPVILNKVCSCCCGGPPQRNFKSFTDYADSFTKMGESVGWNKKDIQDGLKVGQIFHHDAEFARQIIQGPNSTRLRRVENLSDTWQEAIDKDMLPTYAIDGEDLNAVIKDGRLFEILYSEILNDIGHGGENSKFITGTTQTWYVVQADCLLFQSNTRPEDKSFVPVLIRLENKNDGEKQTWWHPAENDTSMTDPKYLSWLLAKMYFRCADWGIYSIGTHYARAHAMNEVFASSMYRNLPSAHPLLRLLQPHFQGIIGINMQARKVLISPTENAFANFMSSGDDLPQLLVNCCKELDYEHLVIPKDFESRGLKDLPNFFFRDDSEDLWMILLDYVKNMVDLSYLSEDDVSKDTELQKFVEEIRGPGFEGFGGAGFPESIETKEKLVEYLTALIFNVSCFHTGVNFQTNKYLGHLVNAPPSLRLPPPEQDDVITMERIMNSLPQYEVALATMVIIGVLSNFSPIERFYVETKAENRQGYLGENLAVSLEQEGHIKDMVKEMEKLRDKIADRNKGKYLAYDVLSPNNIPITTQT